MEKILFITFHRKCIIKDLAIFKIRKHPNLHRTLNSYILLRKIVYFLSQIAFADEKKHAFFWQIVIMWSWMGFTVDLLLDGWCNLNLSYFYKRADTKVHNCSQCSYFAMTAKVNKTITAFENFCRFDFRKKNLKWIENHALKNILLLSLLCIIKIFW